MKYVQGSFVFYCKKYAYAKTRLLARKYSFLFFYFFSSSEHCNKGCTDARALLGSVQFDGIAGIAKDLDESYNNHHFLYQK